MTHIENMTDRDEYGRPLPSPMPVQDTQEQNRQPDHDHSEPRPGRHGGRGLHGADVAAHQLRAGLAELVGTFFLVFTGTAVAVSAALNRPVAGAAYDSLAVALAFGLVLAAMVGALGHVSGAHLNPAVTLGLAATRHFPWRYVPAYLAAQLLGAVLGAAATWATLGDAGRSRAKLGATSPTSGVGDLRAFVVEALITLLLVFVIIAVATDDQVPDAMASTSIGFALAAAVLIGGPVTGGAVNPVRAFGPQLVAGFFPSCWVYLLAPVLGGIAAAVLYDRVARQIDPPDTDN